jgi:hypothetical protein
VEIITWFAVQVGCRRVYHAQWEGTALCERKEPLPLHFYQIVVLNPGMTGCESCRANLKAVQRRQATPRDQWEAQKPAPEPLEPGSRG